MKVMGRAKWKAVGFGVDTGDNINLCPGATDGGLPSGPAQVPIQTKLASTHGQCLMVKVTEI